MMMEVYKCDFLNGMEIDRHIESLFSRFHL